MKGKQHTGKVAPSNDTRASIPTLGEMGLTKDESSRPSAKAEDDGYVGRLCAAAETAIGPAVTGVASGGWALSKACS